MGKSISTPTPNRKKKLWLVVVLALAVGGVFAYFRLKPELARAKADAIEAAKSPKMHVRDNLVRLSAMADDYFAKHPEAQSVVVKDLVQATPGATLPTPILGEAYDDLVISKNAASLKIKLADGGELTVPKH